VSATSDVAEGRTARDGWVHADSATEEIPAIAELPLASNERGHKVVDAVEQKTVDGLLLDDLMTDGRLDMYDEVRRAGLFRVNLTKDGIVIQATGHIGLIAVNERVSVNVKPRVPVPNLQRILRVTEHRFVSLKPHVRGYAAHSESIPSLLNLLAESLLDSIDDVAAKGVYRAYIQKDGDTTFPRGHILMGKTLRRHVARDIHHRVAAAWFEPTVDIAPNRCLKYAVWHLGQRYASVAWPRKDPARGIMRRLNRAYHLFDGVRLERSRSFLDDPTVQQPGRLPSIRAYYRSALDLAVTIVRDRGIRFDVSGKDVVLASLLLNLADLFEKYALGILRSRLTTLPSVVVLDGNATERDGGGQKALFDPESPENTEATPDIVFRRAAPCAPEDRYPILIDVKYKPVSGLANRDDVNQAIAYGVSYRAPSVVLLHPRTDDKTPLGRRELGRVGGMTLYEYVFDLSADALEDEEDRFASSMGDLLVNGHDNWFSGTFGDA